MPRTVYTRASYYERRPPGMVGRLGQLRQGGGLGFVAVLAVGEFLLTDASLAVAVCHSFSSRQQRRGLQLHLFAVGVQFIAYSPPADLLRAANCSPAIWLSRQVGGRLATSSFALAAFWENSASFAFARSLDKRWIFAKASPTAKGILLGFPLSKAAGGRNLIVSGLDRHRRRQGPCRSRRWLRRFTIRQVASRLPFWTSPVAVPRSATTSPSTPSLSCRGRRQLLLDRERYRRCLLGILHRQVSRSRRRALLGFRGRRRRRRLSTDCRCSCRLRSTRGFAANRGQHAGRRREGGSSHEVAEAAKFLRYCHPALQLRNVVATGGDHATVVGHLTAKTPPPWAPTTAASRWSFPKPIVVSSRPTRPRSVAAPS